MNTKKYEEVLDSRNREFFRELNLRTRFFIRFEAGAPGLYRRLQSWFHKNG